MDKKYTVIELRKICKEIGIKGYSKMKKEELMKHCLKEKTTIQTEEKTENVVKNVVKQEMQHKEDNINVLFDRILQLQKDMNKSNSTLKKKETLKKYEDLKKVLQYTYDDNYVFSVTSKNYKKFVANSKKNKQKTLIVYYKDLFKLLDDLAIRKITGDTALLHLYNFIKRNKQYEDIILNIIDKNLKIRVNTSVINDVFPGLIKVFEVVLANKYKKSLIDKTNEDWYISRKLDGVRCLTHIDKKNKKVTFYSRQGKEFKTLGNLEKDILVGINGFDGNYFLDGEVVDIVNNKEDFKGIMEKIRRKKYSIPNPKYYVFDMIKEEDFYNLKSNEIYSTRMERLNKTLMSGFHNIEILEQIKYTENDFTELAKRSEEEGWEGLMLRRDVGYEGKRTNSLLKYKKMDDDEYKVIDIEVGPFRRINPETGLEEEIETLSAVIIDYNNTKVGSGFTIDERIEYYKNPKKIVGKVITVQYFEKTTESLRFPTFKGIHGTKRNT